MSARELVLSPEALDVLARSKCDGPSVYLPDEQLKREVYTEVNDALVRIGGKWSKKARAHVFASDAEAALGGILHTGAAPKKNPDAYFPTPRAVIARMLDMATLENFSDIDAPVVLEPSAGTGAIANAIRADYPHVAVHCVEMNETRARQCSDAGNLFVWNADFLDWTPEVEGLEIDCYDAVLMNPPFAVERDASEWIAHVRHAHAMLAPHGVLVAVVPSSYATRTDRKHAAFRAWTEEHGAYTVELPLDAFKESGTGVSTLLLCLRAPSGSNGSET